MDERTRMEELVAQLNGAARAYYVLDDPVMSDARYDELYDELLKLEQETGEVLKDSPSRRVGGEILEGFEPHTHIRRLWSLDKCRDEAGLSEWEGRIDKLLVGTGLTTGGYLVEYKFDGLTLNLTYEHGLLQLGATRGNGTTGENITANVRTIKTIPLRIPFEGRMEVQGEGVMPMSSLERYNESCKTPLKNARNAAAGALRNLDVEVAALRNLDAYFYNVGYIEGRKFNTQQEMLDFLKENGFHVSAETALMPDMNAVLTQLDRIEEQRDKLDVLIDGAVIKVNDLRAQAALGFTGKFPRGAMAYKFKAQEQTTKLLNVVWQVGRTGKLTPLAQLEPVELAGATISRATLNNLYDIERKGVSVGATVWIRRANDVIPEITGVAPGDDETTPVEPPAVCPACGGEVVERGANLFCTNGLGCKPQLVAAIEHYCSRDALDIETLSEKTAELLIDNKLIKNVADLYSLSLDALKELPGFGEKRAQNLLAAIEKSKSPELSRFVYALGIPNVGVQTAGDLASYFHTLEAIESATLEALTAIPEIGGIVASGIVEYFQVPHNLSLLERLKAAGVTAKAHSGQLQDTRFAGQTFVFTGTLDTIGRSEAANLVKARGGKASGSVSKKTDYVVAGEAAGSKLTKAEQLGVKVITEEEFLRMLE